MSRKRSISALLNKDTSSQSKERIKSRSKVACHCNKCNGLLIDPRTKLEHERRQSKNLLQPALTKQDSIDNLDILMDFSSIQEPAVSEDPSIQKSALPEELEFIFQPRKRKPAPNRATFDIPSETDDVQMDNEDNISATSTESDDNNELYDTFEDYSTPPFEHLSDFDENSTDSQFKWIIMWIMNFRIKFNLPNTAIDALIKFIKLLLEDVDGVKFESFCSSLYTANKSLGISDAFVKFVACKKCHKLYNIEKVARFRQDNSISTMKCTHVEFPNSATKRSKICGTALSIQTRLLCGSIKSKPELIFPFATIQHQLADMYQRPGFENSLRHWTNRTTFDNLICDIYDGDIWKTFKEDPFDQKSALFFRHEKADSHLGLVLNLDWFQPYSGLTYSIGVIYAAIANLPHDIRFKRENMLILGVIPGPSEPSLHQINHYISPVVDDLNFLWNGITLNLTAECLEGKTIRAALILVSCDIPAARKLCGHISALVSCHRCNKKANYINNQHNFGDMKNMDEWFIRKDSALHRQKAIEWRRCKSNAARKRFVSENGIRWSELLRLQYFDPIRHVVIDPMHCLFLGIAKWIVKRIWIDEGILTQNMLNEMQHMMQRFQIPTDIGRIPGKINSGEGFSSFTADQWRNFIVIYATVVCWKNLSNTDRRILSHFVQVCQILVCRIVKRNLMNEAHERLIKIIKLIECKYGQEKITPNLHLSLHLCECAYDYGPLYSFWCFSFERMNGFLGSLPNSNRNIESELMRRLSVDKQIIQLTDSENVKGIELLDNQPLVESLSVPNQFSADEMHRFLINTYNIQSSVITGTEKLPGELLHPKKQDSTIPAEMLNILVDYYKAAYETISFRKPFSDDLDDSVIVRDRLNQHGRCRIGSETFGSTMSSRHIKSSFVLAQFVNKDGSIDLYPGQVQYFFTHLLHLPNETKEHKLAYIRWYQSANSAAIRFYFSVDNTCNVELWGTDFYPQKRECIIPIHNIYSRFIPFKYKISNRKNSCEYLAVIPLNRKFNI